MGITTTIPTNLNFPNRGILERDAFVNAQETAQDLLAGAYTTALNQYATELNSTQEEINLKAEQVYNQAVTGGYSQAYIDATFTPKILDTQTDKTTPIDADLIPLSDSAASFGLKKLSWLNIKATLKTYFDTLYMALTGNQTIYGVKTFSTSPIVPTPTTGTQAVNKDYVDNLKIIATGTATFNSTTNNINLTGIGIGVEIGDVIQISGAEDDKNNSEFTVEVITNDNNIIVNQAHANQGTSKNIANRAGDTGVTVKLLAKWYNASIGLGQFWKDITASRSFGVTYTNTTGKSILVAVTDNGVTGGDTSIEVSGLSIIRTGAGSAGLHRYVIAVVPRGSTYKVTSTATLFFWRELR